MPTKSITTYEIPVLGPENFGELSLNLNNLEMTPAQIAALPYEVKERGIGEVSRDDVTVNGEPTRWFVYRGKLPDEMDDGPFRWALWGESIPCSVSWCHGHEVNEADTWDELVHSSEDINFDQGGFAGYASFSRTADGRFAVDIDVEHAGQLTLDELNDYLDGARGFCQTLVNLAKRVETAASIPVEPTPTTAREWVALAMKRGEANA